MCAMGVNAIWSLLILYRIWAAIKREALLTAAEGAGTPEEIDAIFRGVLKTEKGPFELMDIVGLDVVFDIEQHYAAARRDIPEQPRSYLASYLEKGHLGAKSGRGFYRYDSSPSMQPASHQEIASTTAAWDRRKPEHTTYRCLGNRQRHS